jgi:hypothetical protein
MERSGRVDMARAARIVILEQHRMRAVDATATAGMTDRGELPEGSGARMEEAEETGESDEGTPASVLNEEKEDD